MANILTNEISSNKVELYSLNREYIGLIYYNPTMEKCYYKHGNEVLVDAEQLEWINDRMKLIERRRR